MITLRKIVIFIPFITALNINAQTFQRTISWNQNSSKDNSYLFFENAVYDDQKSMIPSYFELFPISSQINDLSQLRISLENSTYLKLDDVEIKKIKITNNISTAKPDYKVYKSRKENFVQATIPTIRKNINGELEKLASFTLIVEYSGFSKKHSKASVLESTSSVLNKGKWINIKVAETGAYKITYTELSSFGLSNLSNITVWGNGGQCLPYMNNIPSTDDLKQIPIYIEKGSDGLFNQGDYILFYAEGPITWKFEELNNFFKHQVNPYSKTISYFLTTDYPTTKRIPETQVTQQPATYQSNYYDERIAYEQNDTNLIKSGRDWFGDSFDIYSTRTYDTKLSNPEPGSAVKIRVRLSARSSTNSSYTLSMSGSSVGTLSLDGVNVGDEESNFISISEKNFTANAPTGNLSMVLTFNKPSPAANGWLDYLTINTRQLLKYQSKQLLFRDIKSIATGIITQFNLQGAKSSLFVWDVSNMHYPLNIKYLLNNGSANISLPTDSLRQFIAFEADKALSVSLVGEVTNQNLHGLPQSDMVIIAHPSLLNQATELAELHRNNDGLSVNLVTTEQVYNEFSSGTRDVSAIRNFMRMLYKRSTNQNDTPKYLLLFGDGSYDNISDKKSNTNLIPTYQSSESINKTSSFVTDDFFGLLDDNEGEADGLLDIGIGRLPVSTTSQAETVVNKIKQYYSNSSLGDWNSQLCFIGDDEDGNIHMSDANSLANYVQSNYGKYNIQKIFFDAYHQESTPMGNRYPDVTNAINNSVNNGALIVNYTGHGNEQWLSHEKVLMLNDVQAWRNFTKLPLFVTATCEFSRFDDYNLISTGEWILLTPNGGGVGLLSTTRLVFSSPNFTLNYNFFKTVFADAANKNSNSFASKYNRLGDVVRITKNISGGGYNKRNFMLLGDPALMLKYPNYNIEVTHINDTPIAELKDTLKALGKVKIKGKIKNFDGTDATNYNGTASVTLFDKEKTITTLANDGGIPMSFTVRDNTIYRGNASVTNGQYSIDLMIPKDINYRFGNGRISLYALNENEIASGFNESIIIGGINKNPTLDNEGPTINIFLNDSKFVSGGISDPNPKLVVKLTDSSGINTTGTGIGHDLIATIYGENEKSILLNDYYKADIDSYQNGKAELQLTSLNYGSNKIKVKAWDVFNNSSEKEIEFVVVNDAKLQIKHLLNYPNPFTDNTAFYFEHNQPLSDFDVLIQIYSPSGKLVKTIRFQETDTGGYRIGPIAWDGKDDYGDRIGRGVYFYRLRVKTSNGKSAELQQKLVILK